MMLGIGKMVKKLRPKPKNEIWIEETKADLAQFFMFKGMATDNAIKAANETVNRYNSKLGEVF